MEKQEQVYYSFPAETLDNLTTKDSLTLNITQPDTEVITLDLNRWDIVSQDIDKHGYMRIKLKRRTV